MKYLRSIYENFSNQEELDTIEDFFIGLIDDGLCTSLKKDTFVEFQTAPISGKIFRINKVEQLLSATN